MRRADNYSAVRVTSDASRGEQLSMI